MTAVHSGWVRVPLFLPVAAVVKKQRDAYPPRRHGPEKKQRDREKTTPAGKNSGTRTHPECPESSRVVPSRSTEQLDSAVRILCNLINGNGETRGLRLGDDGQLPGAALGSDEEQPDPAGL